MECVTATPPSCEAESVIRRLVEIGLKVKK
jgi:hypothetical protein